MAELFANYETDFGLLTSQQFPIELKDRFHGTVCCLGFRDEKKFLNSVNKIRNIKGIFCNRELNLFYQNRYK